ncbi:putative methyltransferase domain-containing protein [Colletotrichum salicis]|uniref:Putative methyltransferase domain-containing protein n=1 Tax=Colletotrichum salicis TaxID=1209931 RepID=A0A135V1C4_9PEZI|nr:putative methyltransferase domain-containing protein [Colletotrichum salicis]
MDDILGPSHDQALLLIGQYSIRSIWVFGANRTRDNILLDFQDFSIIYDLNLSASHLLDFQSALASRNQESYHGRVSRGHGRLQPPIASSSEPTANVITVDPVVENEDTKDAEIESIHTSSTASLGESITEYRRIHGRTYTQKTDYWETNDERQNEGLEIAHYWETLLLDDRLFLARETPQNVLDPGWVPPNCKFQIDDIEQPWTWPVSYFDFVHISHLEGSVADWPKLYSQAFARIKSGGLIEVKEIDVELCSQVLAELNGDHVYKRWGKVMLEAMDRLGKTGTQSRNHGIARGLEAAGFVDVVEHQWAAPIGAWPKDPTLK